MSLIFHRSDGHVSYSEYKGNKSVTRDANVWTQQQLDDLASAAEKGYADGGVSWADRVAKTGQFLASHLTADNLSRLYDLYSLYRSGATRGDARNSLYESSTQRMLLEQYERSDAADRAFIRGISASDIQDRSAANQVNYQADLEDLEQAFNRATPQND